MSKRISVIIVLSILHRPPSLPPSLPPPSLLTPRDSHNTHSDHSTTPPPEWKGRNGSRRDTCRGKRVLRRCRAEG